MMDDIRIIEVSSSSQIKTFATLPFRIYKDNPNWVPYIIADEIKAIRKETNPSYKFCDATFWLAYKGDECVGRIGAIINRLYNEKVGEAVGRFSRAEFINDPQVSSALFMTAENWLKERRMTKVLGPLGFNNLDNQGMLVEGFDHLAAVGSVYHLPYYHKHVEAMGYEKEIDWIEFRLKISDIPEKALRLNEVIQKRFGVKILSFNSKKELKPYTPRIFDILNDSFADLPFVSPFPPDLIEFYTKKYQNFLVPRFVKVIVNEENKVVAFIVSLPTISRALQKAGGKLFPFGFLHLARALKKPAEFELLLTGINPRLQGQGLSALLITELQKEMLKTDAKWVETTGIFETNHKAIEHWKNYEHLQHKRKRCYRKVL
jgi:hypothetical protein